ncbi:sulfatase-like hydrolase/transferase [Neorhodopirellula pilleata]|uniref:Arylsulfatase n=1 Tax=Neorhodopirellula pilleata TaxID=2714738 RepID=A0A5C5ZRE8_9BACT|nr:sulfatase-like hydrolase/transferase [Neorhodopirellula pilleata]TWT89371.1 Arylsulfatase precursor [Neorhodopirellula pilleata]
MDRRRSTFYLFASSNLLICLALAAVGSIAERASAADPPNVVVLLADDLGWAGVGYHEDWFQTPNIDRLVADGVELDRFYVAPMCSPTRAGLMTGRYPIRFGLARAVIPPQRDFGLPVDETTLAESLGKLGYDRRGVFGKWHLGHLRAQWHPLNQGFSHFHGHYNGAIDYFDLTRDGERDWHTDWQPSDEEGYSTDLIADAAANWISEAARLDQPYFCYVPFNAPHSPFQAPDEAIQRFSQLSTGGSGKQAKSREKKLQTLAAMVWVMDQGIGRILDAIERSGESDNTMVWFLSDNGGVGEIPGNNRPLRGNKLTVYEGGIRVPACVRWPSRISPGSRCDETVGYIDIFPTVVAAAGGDPPYISSEPLDGMNLLGLLTGEPSTKQDFRSRHWFSYHGQQGEDNEHLAVTSEGWKLKVNGPRLETLDQLSDGTNRVELFQLSNDPLENNDVSAAHPEQVAELGRMLIQHRSLQPVDSVPPYSVGGKDFTPPSRWRLSPSE